MRDLRRFDFPSTMLIAGPSRCGKSTFVKNLIRNADEMFSRRPAKILWCHPPEYSPKIEALPLRCETHAGVPELGSVGENDLVVLDDLMYEGGGSNVSNFFTRDSHHKRFGIVYILQNVFPQGQKFRTISLNANYIVAFKNNRDKMQIERLCQQIEPRNSKFLLEAFDRATEQPHGYLVLDCTQYTPDRYRYRTGVMPGETVSYFVPNER